MFSPESGSRVNLGKFLKVFTPAEREKLKQMHSILDTSILSKTGPGAIQVNSAVLNQDDSIFNASTTCGDDNLSEEWVPPCLKSTNHWIPPPGYSTNFEVINWNMVDQSLMPERNEEEGDVEYYPLIHVGVTHTRETQRKEAEFSRWYPVLLNSLRPNAVLSLCPTTSFIRLHEMTIGIMAWSSPRPRNYFSLKREQPGESGHEVCIDVPPVTLAYGNRSMEMYSLLNDITIDRKGMESITSQKKNFKPQANMKKDSFLNSKKEQIALMLEAGLALDNMKDYKDLVKSGTDQQLASSRKGGGGTAIAKENERRRNEFRAATGICPKVVVDMREFRSKLPFSLYDSEIEVVPRTLLIGDYVISRDICIERKSLADLRQSLDNGRLAHQLRDLVLGYPRGATLLIELGERVNTVDAAAKGGPLCSWQDGHFLTYKSISSSVKSTWHRLILLLLHFHHTKVLWSTGESMTVNLVSVLKHNKQEPSPDEVSILDSTGVSSTSECEVPSNARVVDRSKRMEHEVVNRSGLDILRKLPGITPGNLPSLLRQIDCVADIARMDRETMVKCLGLDEGTALFRFIHHRADDVVDISVN